MELIGITVIVLLSLVILFTLLGTLVWNKKNSTGIFLACGSNKAQIGWSDDGSNWNASVHQKGSLPFGDGGTAYYINQSTRDFWVAGGDLDGGSTRHLLWSDDQGKTWNDSTGEQFGTNTGSFARFFEYKNGIWVAGGKPNVAGSNMVIYSKDGKNWEKVSGNPFGTGAGTVSVVQYVNDRWLVGGNGGAGNGDVVKIWSSKDGINWTQASGTPFKTGDNSNPTKFAYGNGVFVAVGRETTPDSESIWYSDNGQLWVPSVNQPFKNTGSLWDVVFSDGIFVAVGEYVTGGTVVAYSTNGKDWYSGTFSEEPSGANFVDNILPPNSYVDNWFIGGGTDSSSPTSGKSLAYVSTNGKNWELVDQTIFEQGDIKSSAFGFTGRRNDSEDRSIVVGQDADGEVIYHSDTRKSGTWKKASNSATVFGNGPDNTITQARYG